MNRKIKVKKLDEKSKGKTIFISDIHGNAKSYNKLLEICRFDIHKDRLILLGDLLEKGPQNLELLHQIMNQVKEGDVHCLMGNCDFTVKNAFLSYRLDFLKKILTVRKHSLLHEMAKQINLTFHENTEMESFCQQLRYHFYEEMSFCNDLPHIIETEDIICTHAGIQSETFYGDDFRIPMTTPFFFHTEQKFTKKVICGHMPVTEYQKHIAHFDPIYDVSKNIYCIDGGNVVKEGGQLNALIFEGNKIYTKRTDNLPEAIVQHDVEKDNAIPMFVTWNHGEIEILQTRNDQSYVYSPYLKRSFWVDRFFIEKRNGKYYASDYTNYKIPLKQGNRVKIVKTYGNKAQIKKDGVLGWTYKENVKECI